MKDAVVVGGGIAGLAAGWRLRHYDVELLEAGDRVGGRIRSERRGPYWLNWGAHVLAGAGTSTDLLLNEVGITAVAVPGSLQAVSMNGKFLDRGRIETYPFRIPMSWADRIALMKAGARVGAAVLSKYTKVVKPWPGESTAARQQRIYNFENSRSFRDYLGDLPADAAAMLRTTVSRSGGEPDEISAGAGIGYFSLVLNIGEGLGRGVVGGPSTLTEAIAVALGDRVRLGAEVREIAHRSDSVVVRYRQNDADHEVEARTVVLATTAGVAHRIAVDLPEDIRDALAHVRYGPHVSSAFLTNETTPQRWDDIYAVTTPKRSFAVALNQASIVRGQESARQPGGSLMTFAPAHLGVALLDKTDDEVVQTHLRDLDAAFGGGVAELVVEGHASRWVEGSPYCFPGRGALQPALMRRGSRVFLAGDFLGTLYTETAISTGLSAAQEAMSVVSTGRRSARVGGDACDGSGPESG